MRGSAQPQLSPLTMPSVSRAMPSASAAAPSRSGRPSSGSRTSSRTRAATAAVTIPIGTLTTKIQRQSSWTRSPPIGGPSAAATPPTADQMAIANGRCAAGKAGRIRPSVVGSIIAPPAAWRTRAATRKGIEGAAAQRPEAAAKSSRPEMKTRLRPIRSAMRPAGTSRAAKTIA